MAIYSFDPIFAADPSNAQNVAANAAIIIFDPADAGKAPITITDVTGAALPNPITVNKNGFGPAFQHATLDRVGWFGAGFTGYFTSYEGMKAVATAAQTAAEAAGAAAGADAAAAVSESLGSAVTSAGAAAASANTAATAAAASATAAANAANLVGAPADAAMAAVISGASATKEALDASYAPAGTAQAIGTGASTPASTVTTSSFDLGTTARRVMGTERERIYAILRAPAGQAMNVAPGVLDSTTDPGAGYVTIPAGSEALITDALPVWAYLATSAGNVAVKKEMSA